VAELQCPAGPATFFFSITLSARPSTSSEFYSTFSFLYVFCSTISCTGIMYVQSCACKINLKKGDALEND